MPRDKSGRFRWLHWVLWPLGILLGGLYILYPIVMAAAAAFPVHARVGAPPAGFSELSLRTADGDSLAAWYAPPGNGAAVILLHGAGGSRESVRAYAELLHKRGYGVLAPDLRGHGESSGRTNRMGWQGTADVRAALDYLLTRDDVRAIGGLGLSLGGEVLLGAASSCPEMTAVAAEGATRRSREELLALPSERPLARNLVASVMFTALRLFTLQRPPEPPLLESMRQAQGTRFLLIAAGKVPQEIAYNTLFVETIGARAELWVAPGALHTGAYALLPGEWETRVMRFYESTLNVR